MIISILSFQDTSIFKPILSKKFNKTKKNLLLKEIYNWSQIENQQEGKEQNPEEIWLMFKTLVYLSSNFPTVTFKKFSNTSGESGFKVYKPLKNTNDDPQNFFSIQRFI